jgi:hypothetical protein
VTINRESSEGTSPLGLEEEPPNGRCAEAILYSMLKML